MNIILKNTAQEAFLGVIALNFGLHCHRQEETAPLQFNLVLVYLF